MVINNRGFFNFHIPLNNEQSTTLALSVVEGNNEQPTKIACFDNDKVRSFDPAIQKLAIFAILCLLINN